MDIAGADETVPLEDLLSSVRTPELTAAMARLEGDILIVGVSGKMGPPPLARLAHRASMAAGVRRKNLRRRALHGRRTARRTGTAGMASMLSRAMGLTRPPSRPFPTFRTSSTWSARSSARQGRKPRRGRSMRICRECSPRAFPARASSRSRPAMCIRSRRSKASAPTSARQPARLANTPSPRWPGKRVLEHFSRRNGTPDGDPSPQLRDRATVRRPAGHRRSRAHRCPRRPWHEPRQCHLAARCQRAIALRALEHCASPPLVLNVTGRPAISIRWLAERFGEQFDAVPRFTGTEGTTALLSNAECCEELFGASPVRIEAMIDAVSSWIRADGRSLARPTHFEERTGRF